MIVALMSATAYAADLPRYAPESYCKDVTDMSGGSAMIYSGCIDMEQTSYNNLKLTWAGLAEKTQKYCDGVAKVSGGSYMLLEGCVDMETQAASNQKGFKF
ncbi:hypothetical protein [Bordetella bronchiseptica]|uniref:hypothetical protein n=1 Tax=Bordetella bronchiseptica TaxID=518 RepID=UPI001CE3631B|nr:hypothetical protein [Bordetella bronchiseptica]